MPAALPRISRARRDNRDNRASRRISRALRRSLATLLATAMTVSAAWAGAVLAPVDLSAGPDPADVTSLLDGVGTQLGEGRLLVGASKVSLLPRPDLADPVRFPDATWLQGEEHAAACTTLSESLITTTLGDPAEGAHLATAGPSPWPENPDCIYAGGFGIGPVNPILDWDRHAGDDGFDPALLETSDAHTGHGLWVRSVVLSDGADEVVLTVIDAEGFLYSYANKCVPSGLPVGCGAREIAQRVGADLDIDPAGFTIAATHSHAAPDLLGGWGFVPDWYFAQVYDAIEQSIREAHDGMVEAVVEVGEAQARDYNRERRDTYRSAEEQNLAWLRAVDAGSGEVVATVGAYAGHPTSYGTNDGVAHADWPGVFATDLEARFGGVGMHLMTGLGNLTHAGGRSNSVGGVALADLVPEVGQGHALADTDVRVAAATWDQPVTNVPLNALGLPGFFDRDFRVQPASLATGKSPDTAPCLSASPSSVELQASAARIGTDLAFSAAPGEVFANLTNTVKERSGARVTMPFAQANDALGYMPQQFELHEANVVAGTGFYAGGVLIVNYEDSYAVDRCVGDMVLETTLDLLDELSQ